MYAHSPSSLTSAKASHRMPMIFRSLPKQGVSSTSQIGVCRAFALPPTIAGGSMSRSHCGFQCNALNMLKRSRTVAEHI
eukprot:4805007-Pyramimonas_sp.AAC.1